MARRALPPLSHHEILASAAPVTRGGYHVDLAATDRAARRIAFRPVTLAGEGPGCPAVTERLVLDLGRADRPRLERTFALADGPEARLTVTGGAVRDLVDHALRADGPERFHRSGRSWIADRYEIDLAAGPAPRLVGCEARLPGLTLHLDARTVFGESMTVRLAPLPGAPRPALPDDVLAILGPAWQPLMAADGRWKSALKAPRREPRRSELARARLRRAVAHLEATLAAKPADYHQRHRMARWRTFLRRSTPILAALGVLASLPVIDALFLGEGRQMHPLFHLLPPVLMVAAALAWWREMPRFEIPPRPRPLRDPAWTRAEGGAIA